MTHERAIEESGFGIRMLMLAALSTAVAAACDRPYGEHLPEAHQTTTEVEEIEEQPNDFIGKTVTVIGEIDTTYTDRAFELEGLDWLFSDDVLVVSKNAMKVGQRAMSTDDIVRVTGKVREFSRDKLESELGWQFEPAFEAGWSKRPVIVANEIEVVRRQAIWSDSDLASGLLTRPWPDTWSADKLDRANVSFERTRVTQVGKRSLWIGSHDAALLVVPENPEVLLALEKGDYIKLEGEVRKRSSLGRTLANSELTPSQRKTLESKGVYIAASKLTKASGPSGEQG